MYKKALLGFILFLSLALTFNFCFAADGMNNMVNDVKNAVGETGNKVEDAAKDISNKSKNVTGSVANTMGNMTRDEYNATRTSTDATADTFMGMTDTTWTWLIVGVTAIAIVALIWYYSMQFTKTRDDDNRMD